MMSGISRCTAHVGGNQRAGRSASDSVSRYHRPLCRHADATSDTTYPLDPVLDFLRLLWSIEHGLQRMSKRMEASWESRDPNGSCCGSLVSFRDCRRESSRISSDCTRARSPGILQRLVARGLLERERDPGDSRRARLRLKARAFAYTRTSPGTVEKAVTQALNRVGASDVRAARRVLAEVARRLNEF